MAMYRLLKDEDDKLVSAMSLLPGERILFHAGAQVRVKIGEDDSVIVFLRDYQGSPRDLYLAGFDGDNNEALLSKGQVQEVKIKTALGDTAVALMGVDQGIDTLLALTPLSEAPVLGERARR